MNDSDELDPADFKLPFYAVLLILFFCWPSIVFSDPLYQTDTKDGVQITLLSDKCELKEVSNLPQAASWKEGNKTYKGCWGVSPFGLVMLYFLEDKTVAIVPVQFFQKVQGT